MKSNRLLLVNGSGALIKTITFVIRLNCCISNHLCVVHGELGRKWKIQFLRGFDRVLSYPWKAERNMQESSHSEGENYKGVDGSSWINPSEATIFRSQ